MNCMNNTDKMVIPAKIISKWDFTYYHVSASAFAFLTEILDAPLLCVSALNPLLFENIDSLKKARMTRKRLNLQWDIIETCAHKDSLLSKLRLTDRLYYVNDTEIYSLNNLIHLEV